MKDKITALSELGSAVRAARLNSAKTTTEIAMASGRSRDVLNRLERGQDVSVSSLLNILSAIGYSLSVQPAGRPTLAQMRKRFSDVDEDDLDERALIEDRQRRYAPVSLSSRPTSPSKSRSTRTPRKRDAK